MSLLSSNTVGAITSGATAELADQTEEHHAEDEENMSKEKEA